MFLITSLLCRYHAQEGGRGEVAHIKDSDSRRFDEGLDVELLESYLTRSLFRPLTHQLISIKGFQGLLPPPQSKEGVACVASVSSRAIA